MPKKANPEIDAQIKSANLDDETAALARAVQSVGIALDLLSVDDDTFAEPVETAGDLLVVSRDLETKALREYLKLSKELAPKIRAAERAYRTHRERSARLFAYVTTGGADATESAA